jgi:hypothetical protein
MATLRRGHASGSGRACRSPPSAVSARMLGNALPVWKSSPETTRKRGSRGTHPHRGTDCKTPPPRLLVDHDLVSGCSRLWVFRLAGRCCGQTGNSFADFVGRACDLEIRVNPNSPITTADISVIVVPIRRPSQSTLIVHHAAKQSAHWNQGATSAFRRAPSLNPLQRSSRPRPGCEPNRCRFASDWN